MKLFSRIQRLFRRDAFLMQFLPSVVVFGILFVFALVNWQNAKYSLTAQYEKAVQQRIILAEDRLEERMQTSGTLARAGGGLLHGSDDVSYDEWRRFYANITGDEAFKAGVVGYTPLVTADNKTTFENQLQEQGFDKGIDTLGSPSIMFPVQFITTFDNDESLSYGKDLYANASYRAAMDAARDSNEVKMTSYIKDNETQSGGVILFMPEYSNDLPIKTVEDRRVALEGFVYETLEFNKLFSGIVDQQDATTFGFTVSEITQNNQKEKIYTYLDAGAMTGESKKPFSTSMIDEYGKKWALDYYAPSTILPATERTRPVNTLAVGVGLALIASLLVFMLIKYRTRLFALAGEQKLQKAKDELLSLASHQLRTPATGVKQYLGMVLDGFGGPVPKNQIKLLEQAYKSNERQLQIINDFLYVAKLGSGSLTTTRHKFDLALLIRDVLEEMNLDITDKKHKMKASIPNTLIVKADEHSIRMIVENLISNAVKYTKPGGKIDIQLKKTARETLFSVSDNGVGISKKDQKLLFKQFSRIPNALTNDVSGSGIGLYLAQQLAVRNGGKISVVSEHLKGSTFTLSLPNWHVKKITIRGQNA